MQNPTYVCLLQIHFELSDLYSLDFGMKGINIEFFISLHGGAPDLIPGEILPWKKGIKVLTFKH